MTDRDRLEELKRGRARTWRFRAEEMRVLAEDVTDDRVREAMLRCARDYDAMADRCEGKKE
jgi:hypothetical protein